MQAEPLVSRRCCSAHHCCMIPVVFTSGCSFLVVLQDALPAMVRSLVSKCPALMLARIWDLHRSRVVILQPWPVHTLFAQVDRAPTLGPQDFASLLYTLGTFGVHPGPKAMAALAGPLTRALPRCVRGAGP
jgi:hypothetical protein